MDLTAQISNLSTKRCEIFYADDRYGDAIVMGYDATILVFRIRYDIDTILTKYRDIYTISIFYK